MAEGGEERTEKASPKKREDERKKGNVFTSKDITVVITLIASFFALQLFVSSFMSRIQQNYMGQMARAQVLETLTVPEVMSIAREIAMVVALTALPIALIVVVLTIATVMGQTKFLFSTEQLKFKLERLSPIKGIKKMFSMRSLVELTKSLIKIILLIWLLYGKVRNAMAQVPNMYDWDIMQAAVFTGKQTISLVLSVAIAYGAVAALDYMYQWWEYEKGIKMTKQEVKDEYKNMEGNPEVKSARRQKQREYAMNRMMQEVQNADVVVRNPTHYAVALKYNMDVDTAPMVLAKGMDNIALRIVEEAQKHNVTTVENKTLARGLYEAAEIDSAIPGEFFQPVAELLAWLYSTREKEKQKR